VPLHLPHLQLNELQFRVHLGGLLAP
jgi:hypothetical protein